MNIFPNVNLIHGNVPDAIIYTCQSCGATCHYKMAETAHVVAVN
ncbi:MAG: hypothetical protein PUB18_00040 [bacterium]|nr:hypothetical protein [bacterium]